MERILKHKVLEDIKLVEFVIVKTFVEDDEFINVYLYPYTIYGKRELSMYFYASNFKNPSVLKYTKTSRMESVEDIENLLKVYPSHNHLVWKMLNWLHNLTNKDICKDGLFNMGKNEVLINIKAPKFYEDIELRVLLGHSNDASIGFQIVDEKEKRFALIDLYEDGSSKVNDFDRYNISSSFLPFREEEHNRLLAHFNASLNDIKMEIQDFVSKLDIEEWLSEVTFPTSGGRNKE